MSAEGTVADVLAGRARQCLHHGDTRKVLASMESESLDLVVTDPPFGIKHDSNRDGSEWAKQIEGDDAVDVSWLSDLARAMKPATALYLFTRWDVEHPWCEAIRAAGLRIVQSIVWDRGTHGSGDLKGAFGYSHERVIFATKGRHLLRGPRLGDVWRVPAIFSREWRWHPHEKPVDLLRIPIAASSDPDAVVFDGFAGSASTLAAARAMGRRAIGVELDPQWHAWASKRLAGAQRRDPDGEGLARQPTLFDLAGSAK